MAATKRRIIIPMKYIRIDSGRNTVAVRSPNHGYFRGRRATSKNPDQTAVLRLAHNTDLNHDGKITGREIGGSIQGRSSTMVRASDRNKSYIRRL